MKRRLDKDRDLPHAGLFLGGGEGIFSPMKRSVLLLFLVSTVAWAFGDIIVKNVPQAATVGSDIRVTWNTEDESAVVRFTVVRRAGTTGDFVELSQLPPKGNYSSYEFVDRSVFRATSGIFQYRIRVYTTGSTFSETEIVTVSHVSSTAQRTWGSIKAMFR